jgi:probable phosphoglycerate mutase
MKLIIYTDGGSRSNSATEPGPASCAFVAFDEQHKYVACLNETLIGSNNVAEYRGLLLAVNSLDPLLDFTSDVDRIEFRADSQLLVNQMTREWRCKDENLIALQHQIREILAFYSGIVISYVWYPREENRDADYLCNLALDGTIIDNMFGPLPVKTKVKGISAGQLFRAGRLTEAKPLRVDPEGYALCGSCKARLINCKCPPLEEAA